MQPKFYPPGPEKIPDNLTTPNKAFKKHIWIATGALLLFIFVYLGLSGWFFYRSLRLLINLWNGGNGGILTFAVAVLMGLLGVFMMKGLFFIRRRDESKSIQITKEMEPELFAFIYKIADEVKAPRPHKVFISDVVNACVFYDVSIINLLFPSKKNLEIGLGLVNTLNLTEFKSILAHEFGHFAQKSMIIGRWVYIAQQVAYQIISRRDIFDNFINGLSRFDLRIAWVGWLLSIIVWSLRSVSETFFKLVLYTQRALSREMEFHADLVAVSLTGSDALIHALYKLNAADDAYDNAIDFANSQLRNGKIVPDIFSIQSNYIKQLSVVLNNPAYGASPKPPHGDGSTFKVFKEQLAQAPKMWSTHPSNIDREKNAKATYIQSSMDDRSSWIVFSNPDELKRKVTNTLYNNLSDKQTYLAPDEAIVAHNKEFGHVFLQPQYKGVYLSRFVTIPFKKVEDMLLLPSGEQASHNQMSELYPDSIKELLEQLKELEEEVAMLEGLKKKELDAYEGRINYRGKELGRNQLVDAILEAKAETQVVKLKVIAHDQSCRAISFEAAKKAGPGWEAYYVSLLRLVHYCEHSQQDIGDLNRHFYATLDVVVKIKSFGNGHLKPLYEAGNQLSGALLKVYNRIQGMTMGESMKEKVSGPYFKSLFNKFELGTVYEENVVNWIDALPSWVQPTMNGLNELRIAALDELLLLENKLQKTAVSVIISEPAPAAILLEKEYATFDENKPRVVTKKPDLLSRFYHADGLIPTISRLAVAASIVLFAIFFSIGIAKSKVYVYNGFDQVVLVQLNGEEFKLGSHESKYVKIGNGEQVHVKTTNETGIIIEEFKEPISGISNTYIYNVANAALIYEWQVLYGSSTNLEEENYELLGNKRWFEASADYYFEDPPQTVSGKTGEIISKDIIMALDMHPAEQISFISDSAEFSSFITTHALWETATSTHIFTWFALASSLTNFEQTLRSRLERNPNEIISLRFQQDLFKGTRKDAICESQNKMYLSDQNNPDLYYLKCRCMPEGADKDEAFRIGSEKWPENGWLAFANGYSNAQSENWVKAMEYFTKANELLPFLTEANMDEMKRIAQLLDQPLPDNPTIDNIPLIKYIRQIEESKEADYTHQLYAYKLLGQGKLTDAVLYSKPDTNLHACILRLAAVSDGASNELIKTAKSLPLMQGLNSETIIPAMALLAREGEDINVYSKELNNLVGEPSETLLKFMKAVMSKNIKDADTYLLTLTASSKSKACLFGVLILGNKAPQKWNLYASKLLFISEKPYREAAI